MVDRRADRLYTPTRRQETSDRDLRTPGRRDRDRVLYSSALRRLSGITQVMSPAEGSPIHNRLTHTLEVAQIGRSLAESLLHGPQGPEQADAAGGLDPDVVEAAALAHDLGHPPFGHVAEAELNRRVKDGFEGNAQSFRIVTKLATRYLDYEGLNLTRATLNAILKYPWLRGPSGQQQRKWGAYESEREELQFARELSPPSSTEQSIEAQLMDWADDVAYAVHDLEDFYRAGLIPLDRLATDQAELGRFLNAEVERQGEFSRFDPEELSQVFSDLMTYIPVSTPYRGGRRDRANLRTLTSELIDQYISSVSFASSPADERYLVIDLRARMEVSMLKGLTWYYVIHSQSLTTQRFGQRNLIGEVFRILADAAASPSDWYIFPVFYQEMLQSGPTGDRNIERIVADFISSMSEPQVVAAYQRLTGLSLGSAMAPVMP
jgi:dGTPase